MTNDTSDSSVIFNPFNQPSIFTACKQIFENGLKIEEELRECRMLQLEPEKYNNIMAWHKHLCETMFTAFIPKELIPVIIKHNHSSQPSIIKEDS